MTAVVVGGSELAPRPGRARRLGWVTWRQQRSAYLAVALLLGGAAVFLVVTGLQMHHDYRHLGVGTCGALTGPRCQVPLELFVVRWQNWAQYVPRFAMFAPGLIGMFVGGPLVARELEAGTFRFAWTQGRTRTQWIVSRLLLVVIPITGLALAFSALFGWWFRPFEPVMGRMTNGEAYEVAGSVFAARTLFGLVLGILVGAVVRRVVVAIALGGIAWLAVAWPSDVFLRPLIESPVDVPASSSLITNGGWTLSEWYRSPSGQRIGVGSGRMTDLYRRAAASGVRSDHAFQQWLSRHGFVDWVSYQPESRFWHFQLVESAAYLGLALLLGAAVVWWVRHRAS